MSLQINCSEISQFMFQALKIQQFFEKVLIAFETKLEVTSAALSVRYGKCARHSWAAVNRLDQTAKFKEIEQMLLSSDFSLKFVRDL